MSETAGETTENWTSLRAYAEHKGVVLAAVQKAIQSGRIKADALRKDRRGRNAGIEWARADRYWAANTDPVEAARNGKFHDQQPGAAGAGITPAAAPESTAAPADAASMERPPVEGPAGQLDLQPPAAQAPSSKAGENDSYLKARTVKEQFAAKQAELEYLKAVGSLVDASAVGKALTQVLTQLKTSVMRISERKAQLLATETDPQRVHRILNEEFRSVFDECSRHYADLAVAGGVAERVAAVLPDSSEGAGAGAESNDLAMVG